MAQNQKNQKIMKVIKQKIRNHLKLLISKKNRENDDLVDTDIDMDTNVGKNA